MSVFFFFFKQKTAYEMRISDWSSDVCSSDLRGGLEPFLDLVRRDAQIGETRVGKPAPQPRQPARHLFAAQRRDVELETLGQPDHHRRGQRPLTVFDQVQIAGGDRKSGV